MFRTYLYVFILLITAALMTACSKSSVPNPNNIEVNHVEIAEEVTDIPVPSMDKTETMQIIDLIEYDGNKTITITINGKEETGEWIYSGYSNFGFYLPPQMKIVKLYEGHDYKTLNDEGQLTLLEGTLPMRFSDPFENSELSKYTEYTGSDDWGKKNFIISTFSIRNR